MGCSQSTQQDVQASRQREVAAAPANRNPPSPTKSQAAPIKSNRDAQGESGQYSVSYSDQRTLEQDFMKDIIARTTNKFIDVSQTVSVSENKNSSDRAKQYSEKIRTIKVAAPRTAADSRTSEVANALSFATISASDRDQIQRHALNVFNAFSSMQIRHMGDLVVSLPQI